MYSKKNSITASQLVLLIVGSALIFPYTFLPVLETPPANQDVWACVILAIVYIILLSLPLLIILNKFRGFNVVEIFNMIFGKILSKFFLCIWLLFFIACHIACLIMMIIFIKIYVMPSSPEWGIMLFLVVPAAYGIYKGAGVIGRLSLFIVPLIIFSVLIFFVFSIPDMKLELIQPIFADSTFADINAGGMLTAARYSEIVIFFIFSYYVPKKTKLYKSFFIGVAIFGVCFLLILLPVLLVLGSSVAKLQWNPYFVFSRQIEAYDFLRRMHSINLLLWVPMSILKLMIFNYMFGHILKGMFNSKTHRYFSMSSLIIGSVIAVLPFASMPFVHYIRSDEIFPFIVLPSTLIVPLIMLITYLIRKKKLERKINKIKKENNNSASE
ncbi:MAG: endospore germination permease [Clostridia bacterium]|nr:endospore germination permease [Clostridia bacterium]